MVRTPGQVPKNGAVQKGFSLVIFVSQMTGLLSHHSTCVKPEEAAFSFPEIPLDLLDWLYTASVPFAARTWALIYYTQAQILPRSVVFLEEDCPMDKNFR